MSLGHRTVRLTSWGRFPVVTAKVVRPTRQTDLQSLLDDRAHPSLIGRGYGRSYGDAALNTQGVVIEQVYFDRMLAFDETTGVLVAEAGLRLKIFWKCLYHGAGFCLLRRERSTSAWVGRWPVTSMGKITTATVRFPATWNGLSF